MKLAFTEHCLRIQAFSKLILSRPTKEEYELYQKFITIEASAIVNTLFDEIYKEVDETKLMLAVDVPKQD